MVPAGFDQSHERAGKSTDWSLEDGEFTVRATRDVKEGDELLFSYGDQSDRYFALFYGFIPKRNDFNRVKLFENGASARLVPGAVRRAAGRRGVASREGAGGETRVRKVRDVRQRPEDGFTQAFHSRFSFG